jgi:DNA-binding winged helix-turn-helix (wHTH) protein/pimeloyl-ACP methyl ester carboxylesterase
LRYHFFLRTDLLFNRLRPERSAFLAFLFGDMVLDGERRELRAGSALIPIEPLVFDLLDFLIRNRGRVVSKEDLLAAVWRGRTVSDSAIAARINAARRAIGDSGEQQRWIRTVARKGFRFVGDVGEEDGLRALTAQVEQAEHQAQNRVSRGQEITFCRTKDGVNLAVACAGQGMPLVRPCRWFTHVELEWHNPFRSDLYHFLADHFRLIRYDGRCNGLSDWDVADVSFEALQQDLDTVVDALGLRSYALLGVSQGCSLSIAHAVRYPERVSKLVLHGGYALGWSKRAPRRGMDVKTFLTFMREGWGNEHSAFQKMLCTGMLPNASTEMIHWLAELQRAASSPENTIRLRSTFDEIDVVDLLHKVSAPTLVMHCRHDNLVPFEEGRRIATLIPNAKFVTLESENHVPLPDEPAWQKFISEIKAFLSD